MVNNNGIINYQSTIESSNQNVGDNANQVVTSSQKLELENLAKKLLDSLNEVKDLKGDTKEELEDVINAATKEASSDKPKRGILKSFLDQTKNVIGTLAATPALITAYEKWHGFIETFTKSGN
jgi:hypothetical protein